MPPGGKEMHNAKVIIILEIVLCPNLVTCLIVYKKIWVWNLLNLGFYHNLFQEIYNAGPRVAADTSGKFGGRKMMLEIKGLSNEVKQEESKKTSEEASKISGASSVGNSKHTWKGKLSMQSKLSSRSVNHHLKVNMGGFMALNADYHMAKTHPPRNN